MRLIGGRRMVVAAPLVLAALACGSDKGENKPRATAAVESTTTADTAATELTTRPRILFLGTSLTAGLGLEPDSAYPAVIQRLATKDGYAVDVINAGLSGETSAGALRRADWLMSQPLAAVVIETGANDGLRGLDPDSTAANITALIAKVRAAQPRAAVVLAQMEAPTNLGPAFQRRFRAVFPRVARATGVRLLPFLLDGVGGRPDLNQDDGIHPTAEGARKVAATVYKSLRPVLDSLARK
ncbi:MAG: arylesterase [Gemmatimonadaceae bacterium]|nr:arylesterase [Gemmatimonadaceae bacterium]